MYERFLSTSSASSFFLFGPRGTGKSSLIKKRFPDAIYIDLLESQTFRSLLAQPERLEDLIFDNSRTVIIDEVQRSPMLLNEVHRLIENKGIKFILTGSNARKLRKSQANLLAGRALTYNLHPLTIAELGSSVSLEKILQWGLLPSVHDPSKDINPKEYLESYVQVYLEEEILQEGLTRNLDNFSRFLEVASFSQGEQINVSSIARECGIHRKAAESYFSILYDLLLAYRLPVFKKKAKRLLVSQNKFYFFDIGVYSIIKPKGFLDKRENEESILYESLFLQELVATNNYLQTRYEINYWRTKGGLEVDFVLYGKDRLLAFEVKRTTSIRKSHTKGLRAFHQDYSMAERYMIYGGKQRQRQDGITILPIKEALLHLPAILSGTFR